jgi:hypothetical protein
MSKRTCVIESCERIHYGRGWCKRHYLAAWTAGRLDDRPRTFVRAGAPLEERLRHQGWTVTPSGCWEWCGGLNQNGYGWLAQGGGRPIIASRAAYMVWVGEIPEGQFVCHTCDNRRCINPDHLYAGTVLDNAQDAVRRKRTANGERHGGHRLTDVEVSAMRTRYAEGGVTQRQVAIEFGVCQQQVSLVVRGERRREVTHIEEAQ